MMNNSHSFIERSSNDLLLKKSIRFKLITSFFLMVLFIILLYITLFYLSENKNIRNEMIKQGSEISEIFTQMTTPLYFSMDYIAIRDNCHKLVSKNKDVISLLLLDIHGNILIDTESLNRKIIPIDVHYQSIVDTKQFDYREIKSDHQNLLEFTNPIIIFEKTKALIILRISLTDMKKKLAWRTFQAAVISIIILFAASILALFLSRLFIPLKVLMKGTYEISKGNLDHIIPDHHNDEIGELARSFNRMRNSLKISFKNLEKKNTKIKDLNEKLEKHVLKRTAQLTESNDRLKQEINDRKLAETEAKELRNYLSNIVDSMPSMIVGISRYGYITEWNREAEELTGIKADQARNQKLNDVIPDLPVKQDMIDNALIYRKINKLSKIESCINESKYYFDITIYPLKKDNKEGVVIKVDDVTDKKKIEEIIIQTEKMVSIGGLAAGMAHEINNPLAGILQNIQVLNNRMTKKLPGNLIAAKKLNIPFEKINQYIELRDITPMISNIRDMGSRAARIVENMLSFSRKSDSIKKPENINQIIDSTLELAKNDYDLEKKYDFRQIRIIKEYSENTPPVHCLYSEIQQVLFNILKNGAQAMSSGSGSESSGHHPTFFIRVLNIANHVRIEIEDNGPGLPDKIRNRIFEPFFTTKDPGIGSGLGLSVSYFIIKENHNGVLMADSHQGKGSTFTIQLPIAV